MTEAVQSRKAGPLPADLDALADSFREGCKSERERMVGVEWEKVGVYRDTGRAIPYEGPRGVEAILRELERSHGWRPTLSDGRPVALEKNGTQITLEPGGQIELSGKKAACLEENGRELYSHLCVIKKVSDPLGIVWLGLGAQPVSAADEIEWVPKPRYEVMRELLPGKRAHDMMKRTASIQISIDFTSEADAAEKLALALRLAPVFSAMYANSFFSNGAPNGFQSERAEIWRDVDPSRAGLIARALEPGFGFRDYVEYALDVPLLFLQRDGRWVRVGGISFRDFMKRGFEGLRPAWADWELHLTSIFTEARLKTYLEIRSFDCQETALGLSVPALVKGIFYDAAATRGAAALVNRIDAKEWSRLRADVPRRALATKFGSATFLEIARELARLAEEGLASRGCPNEAKFLDPLKTLLRKGRSPAAEFLDRLAPVIPERRLQALLENASITD